MRDVYSIPDFSQPCGAVATFDAAVNTGSVEAVLACVRFDEPWCERVLRERVQAEGWDWLRRIRGENWMYDRRTETYCDVIRSSLLPDGSMCQDVYLTTCVDGVWRVAELPKTSLWREHPVLGCVHVDQYFWEVHRFVQALGQVALLCGKTTLAGPTPVQVNAVQQILAYEHDVRPQICERLFEYYNDGIYGSFFTMDDDGVDHSEFMAPAITVPADVWPLVWQPISLRLPDDISDDVLRFTIDANCSWDPEHGIGIRLADWKIVSFCGNGESWYC